MSKIATSALWDLLAVEPETRNPLFLSLDHRDQCVVLEAAERELGSPYGLWQDDPAGFITVALGETLWARQHDILDALRDHDRVVVPAAHSVGKSHSAARIIAWHVCVWPPGTAVAVSTATKWRQVKNQLWPHIRNVHERANLPGVCLQTEWQIGNHPVAWGYSPNDTDETAFSGIHAPHVLAVVDEAGGISPVLGQSLESVISTDGAKILAIGNPPIDETGSPWMEQCTYSNYWHTVEIPATATPNFTGEQTPVCKVHPGTPEHSIGSHLVTKEWADKIADEETTESAYYIARVLAKFPKDTEQKAIPRSWLEEAQGNENPDHSTWVRLGVDVAADGGDRFAIARAEGYRVTLPFSRRPPSGVTTFDLAGYVLEEILVAQERARELGSDRSVRVKVDAIGIGMGVADTLSAWGGEGLHDSEIVSVSVGERCTRPDAQERFANQRAEMWWTGRELVQPQKGDGRQALALDVPDTVVRDLSMPGYGRTSDGRITIEKKADMRKRGVRSPDEGEAVLLAVYEPGAYSEAEVWTAADLLGR